MVLGTHRVRCALRRTGPVPPERGVGVVGDVGEGLVDGEDEVVAEVSGVHFDGRPGRESRRIPQVVAAVAVVTRSRDDRTGSSSSVIHD
jgi:hypothetical protein